jgi:hypothetical protein
MRPLILRLISGAKLLLMFELNKFLFLFLNDLLVFAGLEGLSFQNLCFADGKGHQLL